MADRKCTTSRTEHIATRHLDTSDLTLGFGAKKTVGDVAMQVTEMPLTKGAPGTVLTLDNAQVPAWQSPGVLPFMVPWLAFTSSNKNLSTGFSSALSDPPYPTEDTVWFFPQPGSVGTLKLVTSGATVGDALSLTYGIQGCKPGQRTLKFCVSPANDKLRLLVALNGTTVFPNTYYVDAITNVDTANIPTTVSVPVTITLGTNTLVVTFTRVNDPSGDGAINFYSENMVIY